MRGRNSTLAKAALRLVTAVVVIAVASVIAVAALRFTAGPAFADTPVIAPSKSATPTSSATPTTSGTPTPVVTPTIPATPTSSATPAIPDTPTAAATPTTSAAPSTPPTPSTPGAQVTLNEGDNGKTVDVTVGSTIVVRLHNAYWSGATSDAPDVLVQQGPTVLVTHGKCESGEGCGTFETTFTAAEIGTANLTATRTVCGESVRCPVDDRTYTVAVEVEPRAS